MCSIQINEKKFSINLFISPQLTPKNSWSWSVANKKKFRPLFIYMMKNKILILKEVLGCLIYCSATGEP